MPWLDIEQRPYPMRATLTGGWLRGRIGARRLDGTLSDGRTAWQPSLGILQTVVPDYRVPVFEEVAARAARPVVIAAGAEFYDPSVVTDPRAQAITRPLINRYILGRRLLWQVGAQRCLLQPDVVVVEWNPRAISTWVLLLLRRLAGRRSLVWGHHAPRGGLRTRTFWLRRTMERLSSGTVVYTESGRRELLKVRQNHPTFAAPNALYRRGEAGPAAAAAPGRDILYVGRLVPQKRPVLLLQAFELARDRLPYGTRLVFVGTGPDADELVARSTNAQIILAGHVSDPAALRDWYASAAFAVSPGYVGLNAVQSLSFGLPMLYADEERHSPEVEALNASNSMTFRAGDVEDLAEALVAMHSDRERWWLSRTVLSDVCAAQYSVEAMVDHLWAAVSATARP